MNRTLAVFALCALAAQAYSAPQLETGAVVCKDVNSLRTAHVASQSGAQHPQLPNECVKTIHPVALNGASGVGQLARITVHQHGHLIEMWTLQAYVKE